MFSANVTTNSAQTVDQTTKKDALALSVRMVQINE